MPDPRLVAKCQARCGSVVGGRWTLERLLGIGGMAAVYLAVNSIGRREAVKILHPELATSSDIRQRFEREALAVNQLRHPGAVDIRDMGLTEDGCPFLVMELLEGETLKERLDRLGDLPRDELLGHVEELLDVLRAAHDAGIIHRDIKLDNLFVTTDGKLKVLDFGIAHLRALKPLTRVGELIGTLTYMAPEQVAGIGVDARTDLFAVGATMFRVIAKRRVHDASSDLSLALAMGTTSAPPLATVAPWVDEALAALVDRALQFRKEDRFQTATEMQAAVRACRAAPPLPSPRLVASGSSTAAPTQAGTSSSGALRAALSGPNARVTQSMTGAPASSRLAKIAVALGVLVVVLTAAVVALVWTRPRAAAAGDEESTDDRAPKHKKKKAPHTKPTSDASGNVAPSSAPSEARSRFVDIPPKDFLAGAAGEVPSAIKKSLGPNVQLLDVLVTRGDLVLTVLSTKETQARESGHATFEGEIVFTQSHEGPAPEDAASRQFSVQAIDFEKLPIMREDAQRRSPPPKKDANDMVLCARDWSRTAPAPIVCSVYLDTEKGRYSFLYEADGRFRKKLD